MGGQLPLDGVRVLDLTTSYAGPTATTYLADMGASVLKVERPGSGDDTRFWGPPFVNGESAWFHSCNRGKASLVLDLQDPRSRAVVTRLLEVADVLVASFNPSKLSSMGLDPEEVRTRFPRLIYCVLSGYGLDGPHANLPGYDLTAQARTGMMSVTGALGGPPQRVSTAVCDVVAGTLAAFTVAAALVRQQTMGVGELIDVSLLDAGLSLMAPRIASFLAGEPEPAPSGATDSVLGVYRSFAASDRSIVVAVGNDHMWRRFCMALDLPELAADTSLATNAGRREHRTRVSAVIADRLARRPAAEWLELLAQVNVPASLVQSLHEVVRDEQVAARRSIRQLSNGFEVVASPWRLGAPGDSDAHEAGDPVGPVGSGGSDRLEEWGVTEEWIFEEIARHVDDLPDVAVSRPAV